MFGRKSNRRTQIVIGIALVLVSLGVILSIGGLITGCSSGGPGGGPLRLEIWQATGPGGVMVKVAVPVRGIDVSFRLPGEVTAVPVRVTGSGGFVAVFEAPPLHLGGFYGPAQLAVPLTVETIDVMGVPDGRGRVVIPLVPDP